VPERQAGHLVTVSITQAAVAERTTFPYDREGRGHLSEEGDAVARIFINHPVSDYDKWRPAFDADKARRAAAGLVDIAVLRDADNPNSIWVVGEGEQEAAEQMFQNPELGKLMEEAGETAPPDIWFA
jgi:hypothetical protein